MESGGTVLMGSGDGLNVFVQVRNPHLLGLFSQALL